MNYMNSLNADNVLIDDDDDDLITNLKLVVRSDEFLNETLKEFVFVHILALF